MRRPYRLVVVLLSWLTLVGCASEQHAAPGVQSTTQPTAQPSQLSQAAPEAASGYAEKSGWIASKYMVAAAHPLAVEAGNAMLRRGGSAIDAAIAAQMVLTLVEPQSSGIGGGAFLLHFDGKTVQAYDGRETAPAAATQDLFRRPDGKAMPFNEAVFGGRAVGVPGVLRMLERAHRQHGRLPWATLFAPAIQLAEQGFVVGPRLALLVAADPYLRSDPEAAAYFYPKGRPIAAGSVLRNPALAETLRRIAKQGADALYRGPLAKAMVVKVRHHPRNPGVLALSDLANYQAKERAPLCTDYRRWTVCGMPPPSSGGLGVAQMLGILQNTDLRRFAPVDGQLQPEAVHLFAEAGRLAYADRARYVADTDFVPLPGGGLAALVDPAYLAARAARIGERSMGQAKPGTPPALQLAWGQDAGLGLPSTSHLSIVDAHGNALAMTSSIENQFGARQMVGGFLLNNQLTDFSFLPEDEEGPVANRVEPGKRPRSTMAPTLVFDKATHELVLSTGSPGGSAIINYVAKVLVATLDWQLDLQQAANLPNFGSRNGPTELEQGRTTSAMIAALQARGHTIRIMEQTSGVHGIMRVQHNGERHWLGAADPRREGVAQGE